MAYTKTVEVFGRAEIKIDLPSFARDLAKELGGTLQPAGEYPNERQIIKVGADHLDLSANNYSGKGRVHAYISAPDVKPGDRNTYEKTHKTESAAVNPNGRAIKHIAADIKRRVIDASQEALRLQREHAANLARKRGELNQHAAALQKATGLRVRVNEGELRASLDSCGTNGHYIGATLYADNTVRVGDLGTVSVDQFKAIVAILNGK